MSGEGNPMFGTVWITDGVANKKILDGEEIPAGWKLGRHVPWVRNPRNSDNHPRTKTCLGNKWYNNGNNTIQVRPNELVPEGYHPGRITKNRRIPKDQ